MTTNWEVRKRRLAEYHAQIAANKRQLIEEARHTASLEVRHNTGHGAETEIVNGQLEGAVFDVDLIEQEGCPCGWEEGRSEADKRYHEQHCWKSDYDTKQQWFADYQNPNSDPQDLQERARDLGITGADWAGYHRRREAARAKIDF